MGADVLMRAAVIGVAAALLAVCGSCGDREESGQTPMAEKVQWESLLKGSGIEGLESGGLSFKREGDALIGADGG
ncbi:MAG TPA: hypothetical protein VI643_06895 [Planctomycetota bacterium]|nr:hypothetical protein [Planctomycetota bacterium]